MASRRYTVLLASALILVSWARADGPSPAPTPGQCARYAEAVAQSIRDRHMPFGGVVDPIYSVAQTVTPAAESYTRAGDSAIWTGHFLAAEAVRYGVTQDPRALDNVRAALTAIGDMVRAPGTGVLARAVMDAPTEASSVENEKPVRAAAAVSDLSATEPTEKPTAEKGTPASWAAGMANEEAHSGVHSAKIPKCAWTAGEEVCSGERNVWWVGHSTRDQYAGVALGLALTLQNVPDAGVQKRAGEIVTRLVDFLETHAWTIHATNGDWVKKPSWSIRNFPEAYWFIFTEYQVASLLQLAKKVNPDKYGKRYWWAYQLTKILPMKSALWAQTSGYQPKHYAAFNVAYAYWYILLGLEQDATKHRKLEEVYQSLRPSIAQDQNAHFNMLDRALHAADQGHDAETVSLLSSLLGKTRWNLTVDNTGHYDGKTAIPIAERINTDFLWQRHPGQLLSYGDGRIESARIDFLLPYWLARQTGVIAGP